MSIFGEHNATRTSSLRERSVNEADLSRLSRALEPKKKTRRLSKSRTRQKATRAANTANGEGKRVLNSRVAKKKRERTSLEVNVAATGTRQSVFAKKTSP